MAQLSEVDSGVAYEQIQRAIESGYGHKSYAYCSQRLEEFDRFLRKMHPGDLVMVTRQGKAYLRLLDGAAYFKKSEQGLSNLRKVHALAERGRPARRERVARASAPAAAEPNLRGRPHRGIRAARPGLSCSRPSLSPSLQPPWRR